jgi:hypothetical protein
MIRSMLLKQQYSEEVGETSEKGETIGLLDRTVPTPIPEVSPATV